MTSWNIIKLNCITEENLMLFYKISKSYLDSDITFDHNALLNCQTILLSCMLTDQKVNTNMTENDINFVNIGLTDKSDIEISRFPSKSLEEINHKLASKCIKILNKNIDQITFSENSRFSYLLLYKAYLYFTSDLKLNNEYVVDKVNCTDSFKNCQKMTQKIADFYKTYNKQFPKQADSLWQERIKKKIHALMEKKKIKGISLKEEACIDNAGVIYADFVISKEEKEEDEKDIVCELNGTHHFFSTKRIRIPLDYVNMKLFTEVFGYNYAEINAKINWENLLSREQERLLLKILKIYKETKQKQEKEIIENKDEHVKN